MAHRWARGGFRLGALVGTRRDALDRRVPSRDALTNLSDAPLAVDDAYTLWMYLDARIRDFPTAARHGLGARLLDVTLDVVDVLLQATYAPRSSPARRDALARANQRIAFLRVLLRGARERHYLSVDQSEHATKLLLSLGGRVGAWLREASKNAP